MSDQEGVRVLTRFPKGADQNVKREFALNLIAALDELGVDPGEAFAVVEAQSELLEEEVDDPKALAAEADALRKEETIGVLMAILDFKREMIDAEEMLDRVLYAVRGIIKGEDGLTHQEHAMLGLGNTDARPFR